MMVKTITFVFLILVSFFSKTNYLALRPAINNSQLSFVVDVPTNNHPLPSSSPQTTDDSQNSGLRNNTSSMSIPQVLLSSFSGGIGVAIVNAIIVRHKDKRERTLKDEDQEYTCREYILQAISKDLLDNSDKLEE